VSPPAQRTGPACSAIVVADRPGSRRLAMLITPSVPPRSIGSTPSYSTIPIRAGPIRTGPIRTGPIHAG
jgi:hypothetical protein